MLTLHVDMIMKLQQDREFLRYYRPVRCDHLRQPDHVFRNQVSGHARTGTRLRIRLFPKVLHAPQR